MSVKLSLIIPVYNAELFILDTLVRLSQWKQSIDYKIEEYWSSFGYYCNFIKNINHRLLIYYKLS